MANNCETLQVYNTQETNVANPTLSPDTYIGKVGEGIGQLQNGITEIHALLEKNKDTPQYNQLCQELEQKLHLLSDTFGSQIASEVDNLIKMCKSIS